MKKAEKEQQSEKPALRVGEVSGGHHKWNVLDVCEKCGIERSLKPIWRKNMTRAGKTWVYLVGGDWTNQNPGCR